MQGQSCTFVTTVGVLHYMWFVFLLAAQRTNLMKFAAIKTTAVQMNMV